MKNNKQKENYKNKKSLLITGSILATVISVGVAQTVVNQADLNNPSSLKQEKSNLSKKYNDKFQRTTGSDVSDSFALGAVSFNNAQFTLDLGDYTLTDSDTIGWESTADSNERWIRNLNDLKLGDPVDTTQTFQIDLAQENTEYKITKLTIDGVSYTIDQLFKTGSSYEGSFSISTVSNDSVQFAMNIGDGYLLSDNDTITYTSSSTSNTISLKSVYVSDASGVFTFKIEGLDSSENYSFTNVYLNGVNNPLSGQDFTTTEVFNLSSFKIIQDNATYQSIQFSIELASGYSLTEQDYIRYNLVVDSTSTYEATLKLEDILLSSDSGVYTFEITGLQETTNYEFTKISIDGIASDLTGKNFNTTTVYKVGSFAVIQDTVDTIDNITESTAKFEFELGDGVVLDKANSNITLKNISASSEEVIKFDDARMTEVSHDDSTNKYTYKVSGLSEKTDYEVSNLEINTLAYTIDSQNTFKTETVYFEMAIVDVTEKEVKFTIELGSEIVPDWGNSTINYKTGSTPSGDIKLSTLTPSAGVDGTNGKVYEFTISGLSEKTSYSITNLVINTDYSYDITGVDFTTDTVYYEDTMTITDTTYNSVKFTIELGNDITPDWTKSTIDYTDGTTPVEGVSLDSLSPEAKGSGTKGKVYEFTISGLSEKTSYSITNLVINTDYSYDITGVDFTTDTVYYEGTMSVTEETFDTIKFTIELGSEIVPDWTKSTISYTDGTTSSGATALESLTPTPSGDGTNGKIYEFTISGLSEKTDYHFEELVINSSEYTYDVSDVSFSTSTVYFEDSMTITSFTHNEAKFTIELGLGIVPDWKNSSITYTDGTDTIGPVTLDTLSPTAGVDGSNGKVYEFTISGLSEKTKYTITNLVINSDYPYDISGVEFTTNTVYYDDSLTIISSNHNSTKFSIELGSELTPDWTKSTISYTDGTTSSGAVALESLTPTPNGDGPSGGKVYEFEITGLSEETNYNFENLVINSSEYTYDVSSVSFSTSTVYFADSMTITSFNHNEAKFTIELGADFVPDWTKSTISYTDGTTPKDVTLDSLSPTTGVDGDNGKVYEFTISGLEEATTYNITKLVINTDYSYDISGVEFTTNTVYYDGSMKVIETNHNSTKFSIELGSELTPDWKTSSITYNDGTNTIGPITLDTLSPTSGVDGDNGKVYEFEITGLSEGTNYNFENLVINSSEYTYDVSDVSFSTSTVYFADSMTITSFTHNEAKFTIELGTDFVPDWTKSTISYTDGTTPKDVTLDSLSPTTGVDGDNGKVYEFTISGLEEATTYNITKLVINTDHSYDISGFEFTTNTVYYDGSIAISELTQKSAKFTIELGADFVPDWTKSTISYTGGTTPKDVTLDSLSPTTGVDGDNGKVYEFTISGLEEATTYNITKLVINTDHSYDISGFEFTTNTVYYDGSIGITESTYNSAKFTIELGTDITPDWDNSTINYTDGTTPSGDIKLSTLNPSAGIDGTNGKVYEFEITGLLEGTNYEITKLVINNDYTYDVSGTTFTTDLIFLEDLALVDGTTTYNSTQISFTLGDKVDISKVKLKIGEKGSEAEVNLSDVATIVGDPDESVAGQIKYTYLIDKYAVDTPMQEGTTYSITEFSTEEKTYTLSSPIEFTTLSLLVDDSFNIVEVKETTVEFSFVVDSLITSITELEVQIEETGDSSTNQILTLSELEEVDNGVEFQYNYKINGLNSKTSYDITSLKINGANASKFTKTTFETNSYFKGEQLHFNPIGKTRNSLEVLFSISTGFEPTDVEILFGETGSETWKKIADLGPMLESSTVDGDTTNWNYSIYYTPEGVLLTEDTEYSIIGTRIGTEEYTVAAGNFTQSVERTIAHDTFVRNSLNATATSATTAEVTFETPFGIKFNFGQSAIYWKVNDGTQEEIPNGNIKAKLDGTTVTLTLSNLNPDTKYEISRIKINGVTINGSAIPESTDSNIFTTPAARDGVTESFDIDESELSKGTFKFKFKTDELVDENNSSIKFGTNSRKTQEIYFSDLTLISNSDGFFTYEINGIDPNTEYTLYSININGKYHTLSGEKVHVTEPEITDNDEPNNVLKIVLITLLSIATLGAITSIIWIKKRKK